MPTFKISKEKSIQSVMHGTPIQTNAGIIALYKKRLLRIIRMMTKETKSKIILLFKKGFIQEYFDDQDKLDSKQRIAMDAKSPSSQARILLVKLKSKYSKLMKTKGKDYVISMIKGANKDSLARVNVSLEQLSGGKIQKIKGSSDPIDEELKNSITWNVSLITNLTDDYYNKMTTVVSKSISAGGSSDIYEEISKYDGMTERRARNIAEDQTRKVFNNLNEQRFKGVGINKFKWNHSSSGQHPRKLHQKMDGKIYSFDDLPVIDERTGETGIPGQAINCGCFMTPVIELTPEEQEELDNAA